MISFTQSRCNNHKPGMAHVFATPGGQSFLHLEVLSTILLWRCRHLRIPQLDKNSTTPPSPTDPTIDSIEPRKIVERRFWIWIQSQLIFNVNRLNLDVRSCILWRCGNSCCWSRSSPSPPSAAVWQSFPLWRAVSVLSQTAGLVNAVGSCGMNYHLIPGLYPFHTPHDQRFCKLIAGAKARS